MFFRKNNQLDDTELALLSLFLRPRKLDTSQWQDIWSRSLRGNYQRTIKRFRRDGLLVEPDLSQRLGIALRVADIKSILRKNGLKLSGRKDALIQRLMESLPALSEREAKMSDAYVCSAAGAEIAQAYKDRMQLLQDETERASRAALEAGNIEVAIRAVRSYQIQVPAPMSGNLAFATSADHKIAFSPMAEEKLYVQSILSARPAILASVSDKALEQLRLGAAMAALWRNNTSRKWIDDVDASELPFSLETSARMVLFYANHIRSLRVMKEAGFRYVKVICGLDKTSCRHCIQMHGAIYPIDSAPELPNPLCECKMGCRCTYAMAELV